jgi:SAM-dependent methyltransferase
VSADEVWLAAEWIFVHSHLPVPPATVLEIGCGPLGGFVPALRRAGYDAVGVDPEAPDEPVYQRVDFEDCQLPPRVDAVVACTSLHHVQDLDDVLDRLAAVLAPKGTVVVVEWARERFDEATARWCFAHLSAPTAPPEPGWLHRHRDEWVASGLPWEAYLNAWAAKEGLHIGEEILRGLDARFDRRLYTLGPYFFADLGDTTALREQEAISAGHIRATGIRYVGLGRSASA